MVLKKPDVFVDTFQVLNTNLLYGKGHLCVYMVQRKDIDKTKILVIL